MDLDALEPLVGAWPRWVQEDYRALQETPRLRLFARALWAGDYSELFDAEIVDNERLCGPQMALPPTSYRARLQGERAAAYDRRLRVQYRDQLAVRLHSNNMRHWSPSLLARSVTYFNTTSGWIRQIEGRQRRLASRPTTLQFLRLMHDCRPQPEWMQNPHVAVFAADQTYEWIGMQKRGRRQSLERVDGQGMPVEIRHEVYVNSIRVAVPFGLGQLSPADRAAISANYGSAYTKPYNVILQPLRPINVRRSLVEFAQDINGLVDGAARVLGILTPQLQFRQIADALFGRPSVDPGGPTHFDVLPPLMRTDTKSYEDMARIFGHLHAHNGGPDVDVEVVWGDGQTCIAAKNIKRRFPRMYRRVVIGVAGLHEHAHFMFSINEGYFDCFLKWCYNRVGCACTHMPTTRPLPNL